jgi:tetratricopeptide (TPR) repeat protein
MAELWVLMVMKSQQDLMTFQRALAPRFLNDTILANEMMLRQNPRDAKAHTEIGSALVMMGKMPEGLARLRVALEIDPEYDEAHYFSGLAHRQMRQLDDARREFEAALKSNPKHPRARGNLGLVFAEQNNLSAAAQQFEAALQLNPQDDIARDMLRQIREAMKEGRQ